MTLSLESQRMGGVVVLTCQGRLVEGSESRVLEEQLNALIPLESCIVVDLSGVHFIDSSGLGLLARFVARARRARGDLKLCGVPVNIGQVLRVTRLASMFDVHPSQTEALAAWYQGSGWPAEPERVRTDILCVAPSSDVLAFLRAMLTQAGYGVMSTDNIADALNLLKATQPRVVLIDHGLRSTRAGGTAEMLNRQLESRAVIELPLNFSAHDAGTAGEDVLEQIAAVMDARGR